MLLVGMSLPPDLGLPVAEIVRQAAVVADDGRIAAREPVAGAGWRAAYPSLDISKGEFPISFIAPGGSGRVALFKAGSY
jgi:hypothetical protein